MIEPIALKDFFISFFTSALIILAGASYAMLYTWSKIKSNSRIKWAAYLSYTVLLVGVAELTRAANFSGVWLMLSVVMVIGYFFAPIGIWHLSVKTHAESTTEDKL